MFNKILLTCYYAIVKNKSITLLERLSQPILIFAEKHPKLHFQVFSYIRDIRERQIKDAKEFQSSSKRPSDNDLALHSFFLFEIFFTEAFNALEKGLDKVYQARPNLFLNKNVADYKEFINKTAPSLTSTGAYINLPILCNINKATIQPFGVSLNSLPDGIKYIQLQLYKTFPSFIILSGQIILEEKVNLDLDKYINGYFESKISLKSLNPRRFGFLSSLPELEKAKAIKDFITEQKTNVEKFINSYFKGLFLSTGEGCPSIEIYTMSRLDISDDLIHWRSSDKDFWRTLGFDWPYRQLIFSNPPFSFFYDHNKELSFSHKLIIDKAQIDTKYYGSTDGAIIMESFLLVTEFIRSFAFIELLNHYINREKCLNTSMENIVNAKPKKSFRNIIRLQQEIFQSSMKTEKIIDEYESLMTRMPGYWRKDQLELFDLKKEKKLADFLLENIDFRKKLLLNPYKLINSHADRFLESKSIQVNYSLQRSIRVLSAILLIAAVIQILVALKIDFSDLLHKIMHVWQNIFSPAL